MSISFKELADVEAILITATGHVDSAAVDAMRARTVQMASQTGYSNYIVDISKLQSIAQGDTFATFDLGDRFRNTGVQFESRTAVIMPADADARRQAEFLHTVELNRGRGDMRYVSSVDEAVRWFAEQSTL
ncbi:MAG: hypothetical protein OEW68_00785 [Gammaproteobacteria bacterium]|nr:hypothetical protein [Gammaproteobacteria bacterium]MDH4313360.1 hypothetical protein [Gammaproteobacteria bacterium]MDH5213728.1 hypothetical protein [Gammaproteobacteria bacterium]MDH5500979.1 hypothetical protein [Gammaproteobacteria bacterium]